MLTFENPDASGWTLLLQLLSTVQMSCRVHKACKACLHASEACAAIVARQKGNSSAKSLAECLLASNSPLFSVECCMLQVNKPDAVDTAAPAVLGVPESAETQTRHEPEGVAATQAAPVMTPVPTAEGAPFTHPQEAAPGTETQQTQEAQPDSLAQAVSSAEADSQAPAAEAEAPQHTVVPAHQGHAQQQDPSSSPPPVTKAPHSQNASAPSQPVYQGAALQNTPFNFGIPDEFDPATHVYTPTNPSARTPTSIPVPQALPQPDSAAARPLSHSSDAPTPHDDSQLRQPVNASGSQGQDSSAALGVETEAQAAPAGEGQPAGLEQQQERQTPPTEAASFSDSPEVRLAPVSLSNSEPACGVACGTSF